MPKSQFISTRSRGMHYRRVQSMTDPVPWDTRAFGYWEARSRFVKAMATRMPPETGDYEYRRDQSIPSLSFGSAFLAYAVAGRQGLLAILDSLGLAPRDAVRAMSLMYAIGRKDTGRIGKWLKTSVARLLCPASGLAGEEPGRRGAPQPGGAAQRLLEQAGQPGLLARFLKAFSAQAAKIYGEDREGIAFIDSQAIEPEGLENPFMKMINPDPQSRWLFAVQKRSGYPLGMVELLQDGLDDGLGEALGVLADAGMAAQSCLLDMRMIDDPSLDFFYGEDGSLAAPYLTRVLAEDPLFRATLAKMDMDAVKHPKNLSFHQDSRIFFSTLPVKAGTRHGQAWLHIGVICGEPTKAQKRQALRKRPAEFCTAKECHGWQIERIVGLLSGRQTTGAEALDEYFALQKAASIANGAACTRRVPVGHTAAQRRGHGLFSAAGLALWGLLAHALYNSAESDVETALEELQHMRCWLRPRWISLDPYWDDEVLATAFLAAGIGCPNTIFLDGRRLRYDPLHDFVYPATVEKDPEESEEDFQAMLDSFVPENWELPLSMRPGWPRSRRPACLGARKRARPLPSAAKSRSAGRAAGKTPESEEEPQ